MNSPSPSPPPAEENLPPSLPLPLSASLLLTSLPTDAHTALALAAQQDQQPQKIKVRFQPIGSAPALTQRVFKISATSRFESVVTFLRKKLGVRREESVFCYINSVFAPGLDEGVGGLWKGNERAGVD
ncbi:Ubiquitin-like protein [Xylographa pallens]|nr:Ubiquitin-like protein [Xylographa pallens]